jgi:hypothetical protein
MAGKTTFIASFFGGSTTTNMRQFRQKINLFLAELSPQKG